MAVAKISSRERLLKLVYPIGITDISYIDTYWLPIDTPAEGPRGGGAARRGAPWGGGARPGATAAAAVGPGRGGARDGFRYK